MIRAALVAFSLSLALTGASRALSDADLCADQGRDLLAAWCGGAAMSLALLPEDAPVAGALVVTGAYTAADRREGGSPKPVGLFVSDGRVVSREFVRMDGVLTIDADGAATLSHRRAARLGAEVFDLNDRTSRAAFLDAATGGWDVAQGHLLIVEGAVDVADQADAPRFRRRILFQTPRGDWGVYDSGAEALTLYEATTRAAARFAPRWALNLDMGSYDYCQIEGRNCGLLPVGETGKLSNLLIVEPAR